LNGETGLRNNTFVM